MHLLVNISYLQFYTSFLPYLLFLTSCLASIYLFVCLSFLSSSPSDAFLLPPRRPSFSCNLLILFFPPSFHPLVYHLFVQSVPSLTFTSIYPFFYFLLFLPLIISTSTFYHFSRIRESSTTIKGKRNSKRIV